jgi:hypothetical protein
VAARVLAASAALLTAACSAVYAPTDVKATIDASVATAEAAADAEATATTRENRLKNPSATVPVLTSPGDVIQTEANPARPTPVAPPARPTGSPLELALKSLVRISVGDTIGTGFVASVSPEQQLALVVADLRQVGGQSRPMLVFNTGGQRAPLQGTVVWTDVDSGLAVIRVCCDGGFLPVRLNLERFLLPGDPLFMLNSNSGTGAEASPLEGNITAVLVDQHGGRFQVQSAVKADRFASGPMFDIDGDFIGFASTAAGSLVFGPADEYIATLVADVNSGALVAPAPDAAPSQASPPATAPPALAPPPTPVPAPTPSASVPPATSTPSPQPTPAVTSQTPTAAASPAPITATPATASATPAATPVTPSPIPTQAASSTPTPVPTVAGTPTRTPTPAPTGTPTPKPASTTPFHEQRELVTLTHFSNADSIVRYETGAVAADVAAEATFANPFGGDSRTWNYGFTIRGSWNDYYIVLVHGDRKWTLHRRTAQGDALVQSGLWGGIKIAAGESNTVSVVAHGQTGYLVVNGRFVTTLDLSTKTGAGEVTLATGAFRGDEYRESATIATSVSVRSLDPVNTEPAVPGTATDGNPQVIQAVSAISDGLVDLEFAPQFPAYGGDWSVDLTVRSAEGSGLNVKLNDQKVMLIEEVAADGARRVLTSSSVDGLRTEASARNRLITLTLGRLLLVTLNGRVVAEYDLEPVRGGVRMTAAVSAGPGLSFNVPAFRVFSMPD